MLVIGCETECPEATGCVVNNAIYTWSQGSTSSAVTSQNYPNPFNPSTVIQFSLPEAAEVSVTVYNSLGQSVKELVTNRSMPAGNHQIEWDGTNYSGKTVSSGIYLYRIEAGQNMVTKKMVLTR
jgi:flagellar hook assembly protein FlgD